ncbi:MAG: FtsX-like permease family protein, partial [Nitrospinaceae bacterium]|nr:FtsX-like permease family protein [Nitrospinaceae bacterium]
PGTEFVFLKELHAMARIPRESPKGFHSLLVELKAVPRDPPHYPLYGKFKARPDRPLTELLAEPGAVVDPSFLLRSGRKVGDSFFLGKIQVTITGTVVSEPDRISRAFSIGPRVFVSRGTLDAAGLVQPGSRVKHRTLIGLPPSMPLDKGVALLERGLQDRGVKIRTYKDMESSLTDSIERMEQYLGSMAVIALLLGGIGVAMIIRTFMAQKLDTIAILKCLGMSSRTIFKIYLFQSFFLGMTGSLLGVTLGYALQFLLPGRVSGLLNVTVEPRFYWMPAAQSLSLGLAITLLFCVWPLLQAVKTRPLRLFRRSFEEEELASGSRKERWGMGLAILMGLAMIVFWQAESVRRGLVFLLALGIAVLVLRAVSGLLLKVLKK